MTRRQAIKTAAMTAGAAALPEAALGAAASPPLAGALNVRQAPFGAKGDGKTDDTAAFQRALDTCGAAGGGAVFAPAGNYFFAGVLNVPNEVALVGVARGPISHNGLRDAGLPKPTDGGTTFLVTAGAGDDGGKSPAFLTLNTNSYLGGVALYYPTQPHDAPVPTSFPYAVHMQGKNPTVENVELLNPYQGILAAGNERHTIRNVTGQPLYRGIYIDGVVDVGRVENVHFNPWWSGGDGPFAWQQAHGQAFVIARTDWQNFTNSFAFGYAVGFLFTQAGMGGCNGTFLGCGIDAANQAVRVEHCQPYGLLFGECNFTAFKGDNPSHLVCAPTFDGALKMSNCAFWGPTRQAARIQGTGSVYLSGCDFYDLQGPSAALTLDGTGGDASPLRARILGCEFWRDAPQIEVTGAVKGVASSNVFRGQARITNNSTRQFVVGDNVAD
ncbi:MAG: hypothetical protein JO250_17965 [Armatimonadetes bacterium]|nr:hypothetical protein [Armatimonadota bacterium]